MVVSPVLMALMLGHEWQLTDVYAWWYLCCMYVHMYTPNSVR
jgi:hypothetical protein